ncbi:MAG: SprT family zinc-dependent metalloprotease [Coriobacteriia bacterium]|nr:SprT family zinc-dependent metalloprotease [Coriobacteriia bacterium]
MAFSDWTTPAQLASTSKRKRSGTRPRKVAPAQLTFFDDLEIWVTRKSVKNINLRVSPPDGRVEISVPWGLSERQLQDFVREHHDWIVAKQQDILNSTMSAASGASKAEVETWRTVVKAFVPPLVAKWEQVLGVRVNKLAYRNMTSRWGSCQPGTGRVCINVRLALYPPECLEYVVVHELCHLRVHGHGPEFWALVESCLPDYRAARKKLQ